MVMQHLDGNMLAGPLSEVFAVEPTTALRRCPHCRLVSSLAQLHVYGPQPGITARCPGCSAIALRMARHPGALWLQLGGSEGAFRFPLAE
ncbi:DUF6510 family protein [Streptomyces sulphureus]|uniref:DUF6510 family protein n=1 Tax=Streptomyces sulphureus TaxID=47758 RepID=UPI00035EC7C3|nr:DUF6510 family protein [Streptomyces sulphureus]